MHYSAYRPAYLASLAIRAGASAIALACTSHAMATNNDLPDAARENVLTIGLGGFIGTRYPGSDQNGFFIGPSLDYAMTNGFFASTLRGVGYGAGTGRFSYSVALGYRDGRKEKDRAFLFNAGSNQLAGMGDIKGAATLNLDASFEALDWLTLGTSLQLPLTARETGATLHVNMSGALYHTDSDTVSWSASAGMGNRKYMQSWFGVNNKQSAQSGFARHKASSGLYEITTSMNWQHTFDRHWSVNTIVGLTKLTGDAANSPIVKKKLSPSAGVMVQYQF